MVGRIDEFHRRFGEVAPFGGDGPFVVGFDEHSAGEPEQGCRVGRHADHVGAAFNFPVEPFDVESAWGAVSALLPVRFPRPLAEPDVPVPEHPALHEFTPMGSGPVVLLTTESVCRPGRGSG